MAVVATGFFDGVHHGHRRVLSVLARKACERGEEAVAVTFWPHPRIVLGNDASSLRLLNSQDEKLALLGEEPGITVRTVGFTEDFARMGAGEYISMLIREFGATCLVLGYDNRFGSDSLTTAHIADLARSMGLEAVVVEPYADESGVVVSSTAIRRLLSEGDVVSAARMLGYRYRISGVVVDGNHLGRTIGFPTANLLLKEPLKALPAVGAYVTSVLVCGREYVGMTNIDANSKVETHILDFCSDIYGQAVSVDFLGRLRDEMHFRSLDELKDQLLLDIGNVRKSCAAVAE